jgi:hypothetical protein
MSYRNPRLLLVTSRPWPIIEPLVQAFIAAGFIVAMAHNDGADTGFGRASIGRYPARPAQFLPVIEHAIRDLAPDLILPTDAASFVPLAELHDRHADLDGWAPVARVIALSLGDPRQYRRVAPGAPLQRFARDHGLPVPNAVEIADETRLRALLASVPFPVVLKSEGDDPRAETVRGIEAGIAAYRRLAGDGRTWRWLAESRLTRLAPSRSRRRRVVSVQQYVDGVAATRMVAARNGRVLGGISIEPLDGAGPALVAKYIEHPALDEITAFVTRALGLSGLIGFDFMLEHGTRHAWLMAVKPYADAADHVAPPGGPNLPAALRQAYAIEPRLPPPANELATATLASGGRA